MIGQHLRASLALLLIFTFLMGYAYPFVITETAQALFPYEANGSLIHKDGIVIGSKLIGQTFTEPQYFYGRPDMHNKTIDDLIADNQKDFANPAAIPVDLVTLSDSDLDPDISIASADFQAPRVAHARDIPLSEVQKIVSENTALRSLNILGENRVNPLILNLALDSYQAGRHE